MKRFAVRFSAFLLALTAVSGAFSMPLLTGKAMPPEPQEVSTRPVYTIVLDAGHGGEDGGAVSAGGVYEKDLNLAIVLLLHDLLQANGIPVVLTRSTDILLYNRNTDFKGRKKALDLAARRKIAEETENCVFVSIHMNAFPQTQYSGLQVWYSPNHADSCQLAESVQQMTRKHLQPENDRRVKPATSSIYLLHHLQMPAILVECGFLSNPSEAEKLDTPAYQQQLAFLLFLSLMEWVSSGTQ